MAQATNAGDPDDAIGARSADGTDASALAGPRRLTIFSFLAMIGEAAGRKALGHLAAGVAFYMLFSVFPSIALAISVAGLLFETADVLTLLDALRPVVPPDAFTLIDAQVRNTIEAGGFSLTSTALISALLAFWSAGAAVRGLITALHISFPATHSFGVIGYYLLSFGLTLAAIGLVVAALGLLILLPAFFNTLRLLVSETLPQILPEQLPNLAAIEEALGLSLRVRAETLAAFELPALICLSAIALTLIYRLGAARGRRPWRAAFLAALGAAVLWTIGSQLLSVYIAEYGDLTKTYGPLGAIAGLMLWFWISAFTLLLGAEVAAALSGQGSPSAEAMSSQEMSSQALSSKAMSSQALASEDLSSEDVSSPEITSPEMASPDKSRLEKTSPE